jgi:hypothetical protein
METLADMLSRYGITDVGDSAMVEVARKKYSEEALSY